MPGNVFIGLSFVLVMQVHPSNVAFIVSRRTAAGLIDMNWECHSCVHLDISIKMIRKGEWKVGNQSTRDSSVQYPICQTSLSTPNRWTNSTVPNITETFEVLPYWFVFPEAVCSLFFSISLNYFFVIRKVPHDVQLMSYDYNNNAALEWKIPTISKSIKFEKSLYPTTQRRSHLLF